MTLYFNVSNCRLHVWWFASPNCCSLQSCIGFDIVRSHLTTRIVITRSSWRPFVSSHSKGKSHLSQHQQPTSLAPPGTHSSSSSEVLGASSNTPTFVASSTNSTICGHSIKWLCYLKVAGSIYSIQLFAHQLWDHIDGTTPCHQLVQILFFYLHGQ